MVPDSIAHVQTKGTFEAEGTPVGSFKIDGWIAFYIATLFFIIGLVKLIFIHQEKLRKGLGQITRRKKK